MSLHESGESYLIYKSVYISQFCGKMDENVEKFSNDAFFGTKTHAIDIQYIEKVVLIFLLVSLSNIFLKS